MKDITRKNIQSLAKEMGLRPPQVQLLLAQERFVARMASLENGKSFIWKGGSLVLRAYRYLEKPRFTVDIDYLIRGLAVSDAKEELEKATKIDLDDGFNFGQITSTPMKRDTPYGGDRFEIQWTFNNKTGSQTLKIDICVGDTVDEIDMSLSGLAILGDVEENLSVKIYPAEYIFAEKLQTAITFGTGNTRLKDFVDMWSLIKKGMNSDKVKDAIEKCFARRETAFDTDKIRDIFNNTEYIELLENAARKNFADLDLPSVSEMMSKIEAFVAKMKLIS